MGITDVLVRERAAARSRYDTKAAAVAAVGAVGGLVGLALVDAALGSEGFDLMTRDALAVARAGDDVDRLYVSWLSYLGVLVWTSAAGASLLASRLAGRGRDGNRTLLVTGGLLSLGLVADDLFQLHESVVPRLTRFTEEHVQLGWALLVVVWVLVNRRALLRSAYAPVILLAGLLLALSMGADALDGAGPMSAVAGLLGGQGVLEDGVKLVGIVCWSAFLWLESAQVVRQVLGAPGAGSFSDSHVTAA